MNQDTKLPLMVYSVGLQKNQCPIERKEGSNLYQLVFSNEGEGVITFNDRLYEIHTGDIFFLKAKKNHAYEAATQQWSTGWVLFDGEGVESILKAMVLHDHKIFRGQKKDQVWQMYEEMLTISKSRLIDKELLLSSKLYNMMVTLYQQDKFHLSTNVNRASQIVNQVQQHIHDYYAKDLSLESLSEIGQITPQYLSKCFKETLNCGVVEYMTRVRLQRAKGLLVNTRMPIKMIAESVGFKDTSYFGLVFKKYENMTPSQYRR